jgi:hypothetical protein
LGRVILLIIIGLLIVAVFRTFFRAQVREVPASRSLEGEDMVVCARCGVNLPRSEAISEGGVFHCKDNPRCNAP